MTPLRVLCFGECGTKLFIVGERPVLGEEADQWEEVGRQESILVGWI
jgi:hypothetical protein